MNRRDFLRNTGLTALTAWAGTSMVLSACHTEEDMIGEPNWVVEGSFDRPLPLPAVVQSGAFLIAGYASHSILKGKTTPTLSYGGGVLGPTIIGSSSETVNISLINDLSEETNIHWHGLVLPEDMDGHPKDVAPPGGSINYVLPVQQRAGTYWYHPHPHGLTASQVFRGLAGMFIVRDQEEAALNLPSGEFEIPLIIQDKHFNGSDLDYSPTEEETMTGYLGEQVIVNGIHSPVLTVARGWYRFRVLNGSTARVYKLAFGDMTFHIIGADGGLLRSPEPTKDIMLGPGERIDVLMDFSSLSAGKEFFLKSHKFSNYNVQGRQGFDIMKFKVEDRAGATISLPAVLSGIPELNHGHATRTRTFDVTANAMGGHGGSGGHAINGKLYELERVDETVTAGTTEVWEFDNMMGEEIHPMHVHGVQFQVMERHGGRNTVIASEKGWKDTVLVMPGEKVKVIMTFPQYTGVFVLHCHNLEHEDDGMMQNYRIIQ